MGEVQKRQQYLSELFNIEVIKKMCLEDLVNDEMILDMLYLSDVNNQDIKDWICDSLVYCRNGGFLEKMEKDSIPFHDGMEHQKFCMQVDKEMEEEKQQKTKQKKSYRVSEKQETEYVDPLFTLIWEKVMCDENIKSNR